MNSTYYKLYFRNLIENFEFDNEAYFVDTEKYEEDIIYKKEILANEKLYFIKMNDEVYFDFLGRNVFKKANNNIFYNQRTGLYFEEDKLIKTNDSNEVLNKIYDKDYAYYLKDYFKLHRYLNIKDDKLITKTLGLMLVKGNKFTKN